MLITDKIQILIHDHLEILKKRLKLYMLLYVLKLYKNRVVILATPTHGNLGDHAIVYAEKRILKASFASKRIIEVPNDLYLEFTDIICNALKADETIVIDGGGNLGTIWKNEDDKIAGIISKFSNKRIIVFPQTCFYDDVATTVERIDRNRKIYSNASRLTIMLRDQSSYQLFKGLFPETKSYLVPDIVLSLNYRNIPQKRNGVMICFRSDCEKTSKDLDKELICSALKHQGYRIMYSSTYIACSVRGRNRLEKLKEKLAEFASAEIVVTDRLHAMIFCAVTGTPCIALDNISNKVSGGYAWINKLGYISFVENFNIVDLERIVSKITSADQSIRFKYPLSTIKEIIQEEYY